MSNKSQGNTAPKPLSFSLQEVEYNGEKFNEVRIDIDTKTTVSVGTDVYFESMQAAIKKSLGDGASLKVIPKKAYL